MHGIFFDLTIALVFATLLAIFFKFIKQPPTLAYILAGVLLGPLGLIKIQEPEALNSFAEIGITLLLFMLGLEMRLSELRSVGKVSLITGISQIVFTSLIGFVIAILLGFNPLTSFYIAIGLTFSSTIIIVKLLSDKKDIYSLYGKISIGFLLVQDFCAILFLVILAGFDSATGEAFSLSNLLIVILKAIVVFAVVIFLSRSIFPKIVHSLSTSMEILFLFSLAWAFGLSMLVSSEYIGLSIEIGGFLAGLALANATESYQIVTKIKSLRDFFITLFFVTLGMNLVLDNFLPVLIPGIILSLFVLIGNPIIVMIIMGIMGFRKRTSFSAGLTVAQISEFSLIVIFLGRKLGHLSEEVVSLITLIAIITFTLSTYAILGDKKLFELLKDYLGIFERKRNEEKSYKKISEIKNHIIIAGADRVGRSTLQNLKKLKDEVIVVDFNPDIIDEVEGMGFNVVFGDIADNDIQEKINLSKARIIFSTIPDTEENIIVANALRNARSKAKLIVVGYQFTQDIQDLYDAGVDFVLLPHMLAGDTIGKIIRKNDLEYLEKLKNNGHSHLVAS